MSTGHKMEDAAAEGEGEEADQAKDEAQNVQMEIEDDNVDLQAADQASPESGKPEHLIE